MATRGINRPQGTTPIYASPPSHDRLLADRHTGSLGLRFETLSGQYVSPSTGRLTIALKGNEEIVVQGGARRGQVLILPGSGIKGAVRSVYEILSASCNPLSHGCKVKPQNRNAPSEPFQVCEACSLFGCLGWSGRVSFDDAVPDPAAPGVAEVVDVPTPWKPRPERTPGEFRIYDLSAFRPSAHGKKRPRRPATPPPPVLRIAREVYRGRFRGVLRFENATAEELGRLLLALGLAPEGKRRFPLRLGGVKYDGKGAVGVRPERIYLMFPRPETLEGEACDERCDAWLAVALKSPAASRFEGTLQQLADILTSSPTGA